MPNKNYHSAVLTDKGKYYEFAQRKLAPGLMLVLGIKGGNTENHSYHFLKKRFTVEESKKWLNEHKIKYTNFEPASEKKEIQSFQVDIQCLQLKQFTQDQILKLIPKDKLDQILTADSHPFFTAYSIAHEGTSNPKILNEKAKPITWLKGAIQSIKNKILTGIKFYKDHNDDNSTTNRRELGEVVADLQQDINGTLHHIVIGYHPQNVVSEIKKYDVCSQEGVWDLLDRGAVYLAQKLDAITGIALGKSGEDVPAFAGAQRLGMVQAFDNIDMTPGRVKSMAISWDDLLTAKIEDVRKLVKEKEYHVNQLFSDESWIKDDRVYGKVYKENETLADIIKQRDAEKVILMAEIEKQKQETEKVKLELDKRILTEKSIIRREQEATAKERFDKLLTIQKATEVQKKYAKPRFKPEKMENLTDDGLTTRLAEILEDYKTDAAEGIIKDETIQPAGGGNPATRGTGNGDVDYTDPKNNDLLVEEE